MDYFFDYAVFDFEEATIWFLESFYSLLQVFYNQRYSWLFYLAMFPIVFMFIFDIIFSFIMSFRYRELRLFNCFSSKSWRMFNDSRFVSQRYNSIADNKNYSREPSLKFSRFSSLAMSFRQYKNAKAGDVIRCKDGQRYIYQGVKLHTNGNVLYVYRNRNGLYYSSLNPSKWSRALGSQRNNSIMKSYKKNYERGFNNG